jgi:hypothetical protein
MRSKLFQKNWNAKKSPQNNDDFSHPKHNYRSAYALVQNMSPIHILHVHEPNYFQQV